MPSRPVLTGSILLLLTGCGGPSAAPVSPAARNTVLFWGSEFRVRADLGAVTVNRQALDLVLLFDQTASMGNVIETARANASTILQDIRSRYPNSAFGVAALSDYVPGEVPWTLYQTLTLDLDAATAGLHAIRLTNGVDYPEAYSRALDEMRYLTWRPGARRYVVLLGDAPAKDPTFYGMDLGIDPGRDGVPGTQDDLRFADVVESLAADSIVVLAVYDGTKKKPLRAETRKGFDYLAARTGGVSLPIKQSQEVVEIVQLGLQRVLQPAPRLSVPRAFTDWVTATSFERIDSTSNVFVSPASVGAPAGTCAGIYRFPLTVVRGGQAGTDTVGHVWITARVGLMHLPWRVPLLVLFTLLLLGWQVLRTFGPAPLLVRYEQNHPLIGLLARMTLAGLVVGAGVAVWRYAPGTIPPHLAAMSDAAQLPAVGGDVGPTDTDESDAKRCRSPLAVRATPDEDGEVSR